MKSQNLLAASVSENENPDTPLKLKADAGSLLETCGVSNYFNCKRIYYGYFGLIPSIKIIRHINYKRAARWVETELSNQVLQKHCKEDASVYKRKMFCVNVIYLLKNKLLIDIDFNGDVCVLYANGQEAAAQNIVNKLKKFKERSNESNINLVVYESGLTLRAIKNKKPKLSILENYNDNLAELHKSITQELGKDNNSGLFLFYGKPGTGKTTYLRYLIHLLKKKKVIFLPPAIAGDLGSPSLTKMLLENGNSIIIIEDAENLITSRDKWDNSSISMLLNLTDGMLGESLGIKFICTFNTALTNIDKALLRKGRLKALYEFEALSITKSKAMLDKLGIHNYMVTEPMTLADIYNVKERNFELEVNKRKPIGFAIQAA